MGLYSAIAGMQSTAIAAGTSSATVIKANPGIFYGIIVSTVGAGLPVVYDNASAASGKVVGAAVASAPLGPISGFPPTGIPCSNGITVAGGATQPGMTILWS